MLSQSQNRKPTLGIFGPEKGDNTGVTDYSNIIEGCLREEFECYRIANRNYKSPSSFDLVLYNIGNNIFHKCSFEGLKERKGPTIIHEFNCLDYYLSNWNELEDKERQFLLHGYSQKVSKEFRSLVDIIDFFKNHPELDRFSLDLCSEELFISRTSRALVHSKSVLNFLQKRYKEHSFSHLPHLVERVDRNAKDVRRKYLGTDWSRFTFGTFGYLGEYKRIEKLIEAWNKFSKYNPEPILCIVGEKQYPIEIPESDTLRYFGKIDDISDFDAFLTSIDCGVQLRFPSLGETSGVMSKLLAHSIPIITSDIPFTSDLKGSSKVVTVAPDANEISGLVSAFTTALDWGRSISVYNEIYSAANIGKQLKAILDMEIAQ